MPTKKTKPIQEQTKIPQNEGKLTTKQIAYMALRKEGLNQCEAAENAGITRGYSTHLERKFNKKYDLTDTKMVSKAHKAIKKLIEGKPVGTVEKVKDSTVLAAASMVMDRDQPIVRQNLNLNINKTFVKVDITDYQS
jgi:hypothetical protein